MLNKLREKIRKNAALRRLIGYHLASSGLVDHWFRTYQLSEHWEKRKQEILACPDNKAIRRCAEAGAIQKGKQVMHNGIRIQLGSYYGPEYAQVLLQNRGVHEPQEETVFAEVLKHLPPGAVMLELGAFWGFYSMWFNREVTEAKNFLIEPDRFNLGQGKRNFRLNRMYGHFTQAFVGKKTDRTGKIPVVSIDEFMQNQKIEKIHILHSDIQGAEVDMLEGAVKAAAEQRIDYIFISTHASDLHHRCLNWLNSHGFRILAEADLDNTFSEDGLIAAAAHVVPVPERVEIAMKTGRTSAENVNN